MSHEIEETDLHLATEQAWHGLSVVRPEIKIAAAGEDTELDQILFPVFASPLTVQDENGGFTLIESHKAIMRRLPDGNIQPLSVMGADYAHEIDNRALAEAVFGAMEKEGIPHAIESIGTLRHGKLFFASAKLEQRKVNGDEFRCFLNISQSHDGTMSPEACDNSTRIVCANTLRFSQSTKGDLKLKVKKTKFAGLAVAEMGKVVAACLAGHDAMQKCMERLAEVGSNSEQAEALFAAWKGIGVERDGLLSTRAFNQVVDLSDLFLSGKGNKGETLYDAVNAVTEYYTSGNGAGNPDRVNAAKRFTSSEFGTAASHKTEFVHWLSDIADKPSKLKQTLADGRKLVKAKREAISA